jgi:regulator of replication initiation timing
MEALVILEKKIEELVKLVTELKQKNISLIEDNFLLTEDGIELKKKVEELERFSTASSKETEEERELARIMVDSLITDIDAVVKQEH